MHEPTTQMARMPGRLREQRLRRKTRARPQRSVPVIGLAAQDAIAAVDLLEDQDPDQAMRDGHAAESEQPAGATAQGLAVTVRAADREDHVGAAAVLLFAAQKLGKL